MEEPDSPEDLLASFEQAHAAGELNAQELERVRERLGRGPGIAVPESASRDASPASTLPGPLAQRDPNDQPPAGDGGAPGRP